MKHVINSLSKNNGFLTQKSRDVLQIIGVSSSVVALTFQIYNLNYNWKT
jgi:hypothetical protein